jgi:hypothetical protein
LGEERKEKKKREAAGNILPQGQRLDMPCWLCQAGFSWLLGANKGWFRTQFLNFIYTQCDGV